MFTDFSEYTGDSSFNEEMCILFLNYYPKKSERGDCVGQGEEGVRFFTFYMSKVFVLCINNYSSF